MTSGANKQAIVLTVSSVVLLAASIAVVVLEMRGAEEFPWGIHLVTIPAVFLVGLIAGWVMRERQAAEEKARAEL
ncbi:MAG: cation acetate symporter, partial [Planctomycetes bacterium]|nr:cation acetate symporter [Planctomycetota bacterium]